MGKSLQIGDKFIIKFPSFCLQIIDARVANLEEQIEEMKQKIESAESSIKYAEMKKHQEKVEFRFYAFRLNFSLQQKS